MSLLATDLNNTKSETLHVKLLDAVRGCQTNLVGRQDLVSESNSWVSCLCSQFENIFRHKLKTSKSTKGLLSLKQITTGFVADEIVFWNFIKNHLMKHEIDRFEKLVYVSTDVGRGRAWLRSSLNEHSLERYLHIIVGDDITLRNYYEEGAFLLDQERSSTLPNMAAGLSSIYFNIQIDNSSLNGMPKQVANPLGFIPSIINPPMNTISYKTIQPNNDNIEAEHSEKVTKKRSGKQKRATIIMFGETDTYNRLVAASPQSRDGINRNEVIHKTAKNPPKLSNSNLLPQDAKSLSQKSNEKNPDNGNDEEQRAMFVKVIQLKNEVEQANKSIRVLLDTEREYSTTLRLKVEKLEFILKNRVAETTEAQLEAEQEKDILRNHLKKCVGSVQGLGKENSVDEALSEQHLSEEAIVYKEKLVEAAEMQGELLEFNERLTKRLRSSINLLHNMRAELVDLRGPMNSDNRVFQIEKDSFSPVCHSILPPLINIWIPSVFQNGNGPGYHHVYQVYIKMRNEEWNVYRRYSHFYELHTEIRKKYPSVDVYSFPPKKTVGNKGPNFVELRRKGLQNYLRFLVSNTVATHDKFLLHPNKQTFITLMPFFNEVPIMCSIQQPN